VQLQSPTAKADDVLYPTLKQAFKAAAAYKDAAWEQVARGEELHTVLQWEA
jgi:hypothetical protein